MKNISANLKNHLQQECVTLALCWRLRRKDNVQMGFTSHDRSLEFKNFTYQSVTGFVPSNMSSSNDFNVDNLDVKAFLSSHFIKEEDLLSGLYDYAEVEIFQLNWQDSSMGKIKLLSGSLGEIQVNDHHFIAEIRGKTQGLQQVIGAAFSPECRAELGGQSCHVKLDDFEQVSKVSSVISLDIFLDGGGLKPDKYYNYGGLRWVTGRNSGIFCEIKNYETGRITLYDQMPYNIAVGDIYKITAGCDKRAESCKNKFSNFLNFQGEVSIPGNDALFTYPGLK